LTASEFTFLALGLVLGVASGAALIEVLRSRPPAPREVRVTVAPNAIQARLPSTLADPSASLDSSPAAGGPGDRRWHDDPPDPVAAPGGRRASDPLAATVLMARGGAATAASGATATATASAVAAPDTRGTGTPVPIRVDPFRPVTAGATAPALVPVPMSMEPDPLTTALRSTAAAVATAAMAGDRDATRADRLAPSIATAMAADVSDPERGSDGGDVVATPRAEDAGPCADERRVADERCAVATRARAGSDAAAETLRAAQRSYDEQMAAAEAGQAAADPRSVRAAKEAAQQRFRDARSRATSRDDVEGAARSWLAEINEINQETREATARAERSRAAATSLAATLERLAVEADAARISAERADEACVAAREALAACDESRALEAAAVARAVTPVSAEPAAMSEVAATGLAAANDQRDDEFAFAGSRAGQEALILRILRGDRGAMQHAVTRLAADGSDAAHWQGLIGGLADALIARSIEASALEFPPDHFFWGMFNQAENRDIAAGLASLGFRFDGFGGWVDEHQPTQRDLSLAVGYAGQDPMRIRRWPAEAEIRVLFADVRVAADEYVANSAGGLTLGELVSLLGRRADGLTELWNEWGTVRPVLLEGG
jgi:hypothetical protein